MILELDNFYTPEECLAEIAYAEKAGFIEQRYGIAHNTEARRRASIDDTERAFTIWNKLKLPALETFYDGLRPDPFVNNLPEWRAVGLNQRLRYYQYEIGQRFANHFDIMFRINDTTRTFLTFIVYLDEDFEGGETKFADTIIKPKKGSAIVFPHELRHEGMMVTRGCKTVLRTDVVYAERAK
jgi:prolyl 4-hydroxylase